MLFMRRQPIGDFAVLVTRIGSGLWVLPMEQALTITLTRGPARDDALHIRRADGSVAHTHFPKKGPLPHDGVHFFVERALGMHAGFWGMVADGHHPEELAEIAKAAGHASAKRASTPQPHIAELLQAERLVEVFEADHWSGATGDAALLIWSAETACAASHIACPPLDDAQVAAIRADLAGLATAWSALPAGGALHLDWPGTGTS